jgi:hypothetical protein
MNAMPGRPNPKELTPRIRRPSLPSQVKEPTREDRGLRCFRKRRYRSQGDALDAALVAGVERERKAYLCEDCRNWHLTTVHPAPLKSRR